MPNALELREKLRPLLVRINELRDKAEEEKRVFTKEEDANWEALHKEFEGIKDRAEKAEKVESLEAELLADIPDPANQRVGQPDFDSRNSDKPDDNRGQGGDAFVANQDTDLAVRAWVAGGAEGDIPKEQWDAAKRCGINPHAKSINIPLMRTAPRSISEVRALSAITGTAGGATVAEGFIPRLEIALLAYGRIRNLCEVIRTSEGNDLPWPMLDDTSNEGSRVGENKEVDDTDIDFTGLVLKAHKFTSDAIRVPSELIQDSAFNIPQLIGDRLGERLARRQNREYTTGDDTNAPQGAVVGSTLGKTCASATAFTYDEIIEFFHSVDPSYREDFTWMMHDTVLLYLKKLKDGEGNYLWRSGNLANGVPATIEDKPYVINQHMASTVEASAKIILGGKFDAYKCREVNAVQLRRSDDLYIRSDQSVFLAFMRFDGGLLDAGTHPLKHMIMAAA